eukprot:6806292-Prymnesium_polylepis.1
MATLEYGPASPSVSVFLGATVFMLFVVCVGGPILAESVSGGLASSGGSPPLSGVCSLSSSCVSSLAARP